MNTEIESLKANKVYDLVDLPHNRKTGFLNVRQMQMVQ